MVNYLKRITTWIFRSIKNEYLAFGVLFILFISYSYYSKIPDKNESKLIPPDPKLPLPPSGSKMQYFNKAVVSSDAGDCAKIGRDILQKKGSAVDAAIAAMMCNSVVNMHCAGMGGGFFMTIFNKAEKKVYCLNARETAPLQATEDLYRNCDSASKNGSLAIGVPGEIKGYKVAHQKFGKLPWKDIVQPVIDLCDNGYIMNRHQYMSLFKAKLEKDENIRNWFYNNSGKFKKPGSRIYPKKLCDFLRILTVNGPEDFYTGHLSKLFIKDIGDIGGIITEEDLIQYRTEWQEPIHITLKNGDHFYSYPPPGSGVIVALILNILDGYNLTRDDLYGPDSAITYHIIIETFKFAFAQRTKLGDTNFVDIKKIIEKIISKDFATEIRLQIKNHKTYSNPSYYGAEYLSNEDHGTSHISVMDENGDAVAATSTINIYFGAGLTSKRTGLILNSQMDDFAYPHLKSYYGLSGSKSNEMKPGKRPFSSMSPSILIDSNGNVKTVIGAAGGPKIITGIAWVLMRVLWFGDNLKSAIDAARVHHQLRPMKIHYEYGILDDVVKKLQLIGHKIERRSESVVCVLHKDKNNIVGIADQRKDGGGVYGIGNSNPI